jgi:hypothetical protein
MLERGIEEHPFPKLIPKNHKETSHPPETGSSSSSREIQKGEGIHGQTRERHRGLCERNVLTLTLSHGEPNLHGLDI